MIWGLEAQLFHVTNKLHLTFRMVVTW